VGHLPLGFVRCASFDATRTTTGAGGVPIAYDSAGSGDTTLIFVHGWSCDRSYWREQMPAFSGEYRVVAVDLGGHGASPADREDWSIESFGQDAAAVAAAAGADRIVLIGHSMGGLN
jgi:pimeloyl-ACP methyl ester carboxylesterase